VFYYVRRTGRENEVQMKPPFLPFTNCCGVCQSEYGKLAFRWTQEYIPGVPKPMHGYGHALYYFTCLDCGAITVYEVVPIIVQVVAP
jgi:hypothetical protein